ncbi:MAG: DNA-binding protein WhiA, partial [Clostridia bacterium]|nr:DNA-binding protein WhiA [Clostridia bacterium]
CYGFMLFGQSFTEQKISLLTDNEATAKRYAYLIKHCFSVFTKTVVGGGKKTTYKVFVDSQSDRDRIINSLGLVKGQINSIINQNVIKKDCCKNAFIRGMFLACGQASDPVKEYRIDLRIKNPELAYATFDLLYKHNLEPKITLKSLTNVIYLKKSECVEDFLTVIGATPITLKLMDIKAIKDFRSMVNRKGNFEDANNSKVINASVLQREAIEYLINSGKFSLLSDELRFAAELRLNNPYASLSELCKISSVPITRSGLNHRFAKIIEISKEFKEN